MGCCKSLQPASKAELLKEGSKVDFRDVYTIGERLGEGAFGTVFACVEKSCTDGAIYAVKMMEHQSSWWGRFSSSQEAQWEMFAQEFNMLKRMKHPNLIRMVGVYIDDYFVYFVMDKYECNLINAVLPFLKKNQKSLSMSVMGEILHQMLLSIIYMHNELIVHRDVKADNYLVDGNTFKGRNFKVVLTDLSTARHLEEGVFLSDIVGTKEYWAPELIARSYAHKVDVWAIGIILWCMLTMKFPFASVQERFTKKLVKTSQMTEDQFSLIQGLLHKSPLQRLSAKAAAEHPWVQNMSAAHRRSVGRASRVSESSQLEGERRDSGGEMADDATEGQDGPGWGETRQAALDDGGEQSRVLEKMRLADQRFHKGERVAVTLEQKLDQANAGAKGLSAERISVSDKQRVGETKTYEWWSEARCVEKKVPDIDTLCSKEEKDQSADFTSMCAGDVVVGEPANVEYLQSLFKAHNIDVSKFGAGQAKHLADLYRELGKHECCLLVRDGKLIRLLDLVVLRIVSHDGKLLVEANQTFADGRSRAVRRLPAVMCRAKGKGRESALEEVSRLLEEEVKTTDRTVSVDVRFNAEEVNTEMTDSQSYPGLQTIYRRFIFNAKLAKDASAESLAAIGQPAGAAFHTYLVDGTKIAWEWWEEGRCRDTGIPVDPQIQILEDFGGFQQVRGQEWTEASLAQLLAGHKIDTELFGVGQARTIAQLVAEVNSGETWLYEKPSQPGELRRYLEILIVRIKNKFGAYFIETAHSFGRGLKRQRNLFPATKVRPFEDKIWAVRRLLHELEIPFANAKTCFGPRRTEKSTSPSYPNIATVYLKQVVEVQLEDIDLANLENDRLRSAKWYMANKGSSDAGVSGPS